MNKHTCFLALISFFNVDSVFGYFAKCKLPPSQLKRTVEQYAEQFSRDVLDLSCAAPTYYLDKYRWRQAYIASVFYAMRNNELVQRVGEIDASNILRGIPPVKKNRVCDAFYLHSYFSQAQKNWDGQEISIERDWRAIEAEMMREHPGMVNF